MPPAPNRNGVWLILAAVALTLSSLAAGWWLGQLQRGDGQASDRQVRLERQVQELRRRHDRGELDAAETQRLLELLLGLQRRQEAASLLEGLADRQPERWPLRLLLAELRRDLNDRPGAERELRQLLARHPDQVEALQLLALLQLETGRGSQAQALVTAALQRARKPQLQPRALPMGLLLANVLQRQGQPGQAEAVLVSLASDFPRDPRPLLARALLQQEQGRLAEAQNNLAQARSLSPGKVDGRLDRLAAAWGLQALRSAKPAAAPNSAASTGSPLSPPSSSASPSGASPPSESLPGSPGAGSPP